MPDRRHLLSIGDLTRDDVERILETAAALQGVEGKLPTLQGKLVLSLFFESSTRTSASFELAAKRLSADTMSIKSSGSSVDKGESLKDTALTLAAYDPDVIVIRHPQIGAAHCELATSSDPDACRPCTPEPSCQNPCEECELCIGKPDLPDVCSGAGGPVCGDGVRSCDPRTGAGCGDIEYCITGCCVPLPG